jgi:ElaB/YqjD/DUF883 family membrane-anchored ribosome-binding protein
VAGREDATRALCQRLHRRARPATEGGADEAERVARSAVRDARATTSRRAAAALDTPVMAVGTGRTVRETPWATVGDSEIVSDTARSAAGVPAGAGGRPTSARGKDLRCSVVPV